MRIHFQDARRPARVAKLVRAAFAANGKPIGLLGAQDATARLYGYANYHELKSTLGRHPASPWDESCPAETAQSRRAYQVRSLVDSGLPPDRAEAFVAANRPTGGGRTQPPPAASTPPGARLPPEVERALSAAGLRLVPGDGDGLRVAHADVEKPGERHRFTEFLTGKGLVGADAARAALMEQKVTGEPVGHILVRNGHLAPASLIDAVLAFGGPGGPAGTTPVPARAAQAAASGFGPNLTMERLLDDALRSNATDIHIEPRKESYAVFFRRLGERSLAHMGPLAEYAEVLADLKTRSRMDLAERRIGQDGGFQVERCGLFVDLRVATVPALEGEQAIIRVLDPSRARAGLDSLGITRVAEWRRGIGRKNGLCLICGEVGSGRTTTLNATVRDLDGYHKKIYAVSEDASFGIPFVGEVKVTSEAGYGFAQAIRNFMRADPDVMVLGEIRDAETAQNAVKAAERGHLVIATMNSGNILSSVSRLRDLGVPAHELRFILRSVLAQATVKVVCRECDGLGVKGDTPCHACRGGGYSDRTVVSECVTFDNHTDCEAMLALTGPYARNVPDRLPWPEMLDDAIGKMRDGITTSDELRRWFGSQFDERMEALRLDPADFSLDRMRRAAVA